MTPSRKTQAPLGRNGQSVRSGESGGFSALRWRLHGTRSANGDTRSAPIPHNDAASIAFSSVCKSFELIGFHLTTTPKIERTKYIRYKIASNHTQDIWYKKSSHSGYTCGRTQISTNGHMVQSLPTYLLSNFSLHSIQTSLQNTRVG